MMSLKVAASSDSRASSPAHAASCSACAAGVDGFARSQLHFLRSPGGTGQQCPKKKNTLLCPEAQVPRMALRLSKAPRRVSTCMTTSIGRLAGSAVSAAPRLNNSLFVCPFVVGSAVVAPGSAVVVGSAVVGPRLSCSCLVCHGFRPSKNTPKGGGSVITTALK